MKRTKCTFQDNQWVLQDVNVHEWMLQEGVSPEWVKAKIVHFLNSLKNRGYTFDRVEMDQVTSYNVSYQGAKLVEFEVASWGTKNFHYRWRFLDLDRLEDAIYRRDANYLIEAAENYLYDEAVWLPETVRELEAKRQANERAEPQTDSGAVSEEEKPWEKIPGHNWDRQALELWWTGCTHREIGEKVRVTEHTVQNRMTDLRNTYGVEIVPTKKQLQEMWRARNSG